MLIGQNENQLSSFGVPYVQTNPFDKAAPPPKISVLPSLPVQHAITTDLEHVACTLLAEHTFADV